MYTHPHYPSTKTPRTLEHPYGITLDSEWIEWATKEKNGRPKRKHPKRVAAAVLLICETRPVHEVVAKLTPGEFERVVDVVHRSPDHFPSGTLAALKSHSPLPAGRPQSYSVSTDQAPRQGRIGRRSARAGSFPKTEEGAWPLEVFLEWT